MPFWAPLSGVNQHFWRWCNGIFFDVVQTTAYISICLETSYKIHLNACQFFSMKSTLPIRSILNAQFSSKSSHTHCQLSCQLCCTKSQMFRDAFIIFFYGPFFCVYVKKKAISYFYYRCDQLHICMIDRQEIATVSVSYAKAALTMNYRIWCLLKRKLISTPRMQWPLERSPLDVKPKFEAQSNWRHSTDYPKTPLLNRVQIPRHRCSHWNWNWKKKINCQ